MAADELRAARITAAGEGGLSVFRVDGDGLDGLLARIFRASAPRVPRPGELSHGRLVDGGALVDEVVVARIAGGALEISTHGGEATARAVEALLAAAGARIVPAEHVLARNAARMPALAREAARALRDARSPRALEFFAEARERLEDELRSLIAIARGAAAAGPRKASALAALRTRLGTLLLRVAYGRALAEPPVVVLTGAPNAGKSTLLNALARAERAIVTPEAGTTRDLVEEEASLLGFPFRLVDSAGLREGAGGVEAVGIERARAAAEHADVVVVVIDGADPAPRPIKALPARGRALIAVSKSDCSVSPAALEAAAALGLPVVQVSGVAGTGLDHLERAILAHSVFRGAAAGAPACPFTQRQESLIADALAALTGPAGAVLVWLERVLEEERP